MSVGHEVPGKGCGSKLLMRCISFWGQGNTQTKFPDNCRTRPGQSWDSPMIAA